MSSLQDSTPQDDPTLLEALKRCPPAAYYAACKFKLYGRTADLRIVTLGIVERFTERNLRAKLTDASDALRLREDLALDSLTMMEIVMIAEDVLGITASNEELTQLRTLGDVHHFVLNKTMETRRLDTGQPAPVNPSWNISAGGEDLGRIHGQTAGSITPLSG